MEQDMQPANIDDHLPFVLEGISHINRKASEPCDPQEVIKACRAMQAFLFTDKLHSTLVVLEPIADSHPTVNVWIAYSKQGSAIKEYEPEIERLARLIGAKRLTFKSNRKGYKRAMPHWKNTKNSYERYLA